MTELRNTGNERRIHNVPISSVQNLVIGQCLRIIENLDDLFGPESDRELARDELTKIQRDYLAAEAQAKVDAFTARHSEDIGATFDAAVARQPGFRIVDGQLQYSSAWLNDRSAT